MAIAIQDSCSKLQLNKRKYKISGDFTGSAGSTDATRYFFAEFKNANVLDVCGRILNFQTGTASAATVAKLAIIAAVTHPFNRSTNPEIVALTAQFASSNSVALPQTDDIRLIPTALNELMGSTTLRGASDFYGVTKSYQGSGTEALTAQNISSVPFASPTLPLAKAFSKVELGIDITGGTASVITYVEIEIEVLVAEFEHELPGQGLSDTSTSKLGSSVTRDRTTATYALTGTAGQTLVGNAANYTPA